MTRIFRHPLLPVVVTFVIALVTIVALHRMAMEIGWAEVRRDLAGASWSAVLLAVVCTAVSFAASSLLDVFGLASLGVTRIPWRIAALTGAACNAVSNMVGFAYITGLGLRMRVYSSLKIDAATVGGVFVLNTLAVISALAMLLGVLLVVHPAGLEGFGQPTGAGMILLLAIGLVFAWLARGGRRITLRGHSQALPSSKLAAGLMAASMLDIVMASLTLYVLMPDDLAASYPLFFAVFILALGLGIASHVPGGIGPFEATIIAGLGAGGRSDVLAALVLYRLIYTVMPFVVTAVGLAVEWVRDNHQPARRYAGMGYQLAKPLVPAVSAAAALFAGVMLVTSGNLPTEAGRLELLSTLVPLPVIEVSHLLGSVVGVLLMVVARALYAKRRRAWFVAMGLIVMGFVLALLRGLDFADALVLLALFALLSAFRPAFYRDTPTTVFNLDLTWIAGLAALVGTITWIGVFAHSHTAYAAELWWQFALHGGASRFLRAALAGAVVLAGVSLNSLLFRGSAAPPEPIPEAVPRLLAEARGTDHQVALLGDKSFLLAENGRAFLTYADTGRALVAKGDPVGAKADGTALIWKLREQADRSGKLCAFYSISAEYLPAYLDMGLSILKMGEVARVDLATFSLDGSKRKDFRHARARAGREGYVFEVIPAADLEPHLPALRRISDAWLTVKQGEEKSFALGNFDEAYLRAFDHAVLRKAETGQITAFATLWKGAGRHEMAVDLMRYDPAGANFAMDALFGELLLWAKAEGFEWFSLGAAPLSGLENRDLATLWNRIGGLLYEHGEKFYNFEGLRSFKEKFDPVWTPTYLAAPRGLAVARVLYEVNLLVSGGVPMRRRRVI